MKNFTPELENNREHTNKQCLKQTDVKVPALTHTHTHTHTLSLSLSPPPSFRPSINKTIVEWTYDTAVTYIHKPIHRYSHFSRFHHFLILTMLEKGKGI